jgi:DNA sulfur modification protein DndE
MLTLETVRLSDKTKGHLMSLKRKTGIPNWNVLCRWAFCLSLKEPALPPKEKFHKDNSIDMTWKVFGGTHADVYLALLIQRCKRDGFELTPKLLNEQFRLHVHRGIASLVANPNITSISALLSLTKNP